MDAPQFLEPLDVAGELLAHGHFFTESYSTTLFEDNVFVDFQDMSSALLAEDANAFSSLVYVKLALSGSVQR